MSGSEGAEPDPPPKQVPERKRYGKGTNRVNEREGASLSNGRDLDSIAFP